MKPQAFAKQVQRYSIRKYAFGTASVLLGTVFLLGAQPVAAEASRDIVVKTGTEFVGVDAITDVTTNQARASDVDTHQLVEVPEETVESIPLRAKGVATPVEEQEIVTRAVTKEEVAEFVTDEVTRASDPAEIEVIDKVILVDKEVMRGTAPEEAEAKIARFLETKETDKATTLAPSGTYTFTENTDVRNIPDKTAKVEFYIPAGQKVNYDKVVKANGYNWISYVSYSGSRRYAAVELVSANAAAVVTKTKKEESKTTPVVTRELGKVERYIFAETVAVKQEPKVAAETDFYFYKGEGINYDRVLESDGKRWVSYISYSGLRRYAMIGDSQATKPLVKAVTTGNLTIKDSSKDGFTVLVTNVANGQGVKAVKVPVWSEQDGQDDIVWYDAVKQTDGNYYVTVNIASHKGNVGTYHAHLYYVQNDNTLKGVTTVTTVLKDEKAVNTGTAKRDTMVMTKTVEVKNAPESKSPTQFIFKAGDRVNYDRVLTADGYKWISYVSYSGIRRYVALEAITEQSVKAVEPAKVSAFPDRGTYTFTKTSEIKNVPETKAPVQYIYRAGDKVNYDKVLVADGYQWLSYISRTGVRRYVALDQVAEATGKPVVSTNHLASSGRYVFTGHLPAKREARANAATVFTFGLGNSIYYDRLLNADGKQWISYISYTGDRYYVPIN